MLAPAEGLADVAEVAPGKWHSVPSHDECRACHDSGRTEILGFTALQLSDDRDPLAPHAEPLTEDMVTIADAGARKAVVARTCRSRRGTAAHRRARSARACGARYLSANCGSCHNPKSSIASLGLFLQHRADRAASCTASAVATSVGQPGHWVVPTAPAGTSQIVHAGRPELSALLVRARSRRPSSQMPPIGTVIADRAALDLVSAWIASLPAAETSRCPTSATKR